jgi:hypothetical protein
MRQTQSAFSSNPSCPKAWRPCRAGYTTFGGRGTTMPSNLFRSIDPQKFETVNFNPLALLDELSIEKAQELLADANAILRPK